MLKLGKATQLLILLSLFLVTIAGKVAGQNTRGSLAVSNYDISDPAPEVSKLNSISKDADKLNQLLKLGSIYFRIRSSARKANLDTALFYAQSAIDLSRNLKDVEGHNEAAFLACKILMEATDLQAAKKLLIQVSGEEQIRLMLVIGEHYVFQPSGNSTNLDLAMPFIRSALALSESIHSSHWRAQTLLLLGKNYFERGEVEKGKQSFFKIINYYQKVHDRSAEANYWAELARYLPDSETNYKDGLAYFEKARILYQSIGDQEQLGSVYQDMGEMSSINHQYDRAISYYLQDLRILKSIGNQKLYNLYLSLADNYQASGNLTDGLRYALLGLKNIEFMQADAPLPIAYKALGDIYRQLNEPENSTYYYKLILTRPNSSLHLDHFIVLKYYVDELIKKGKSAEALRFTENFISERPPVILASQEIVAASLGNCYNSLGQFKRAEQFYLKMIHLDQLIQSNRGKNIFYSTEISGAEAYYDIAKFYVYRRQFSDAARFLQQALNFPRLPAVLERDIRLLQFKTDFAAGNFNKAIINFERNVFLKDSISAVQRMSEIAQMKVKFETEKQEKNIKLLEKEALIQKKELANSNQLRLFTYAGIIALLLLVGILYNRFRLKQKSNRLLEQQQQMINKKNDALLQVVQEKEWLLREVHHRVKNNLQIVMSLLKSQSTYLHDEGAIKAIIDSRHRIHAMSLIHQKLYKTANISSIYMPEYVHELVDYLRDSFKNIPHVLYKMNIAPVYLDAVHAIPLGLILNEVITNAIKYAFAGQKNAEIEIDFILLPDDQASLSIKDNGCGFPVGFDIMEADSFGLVLVKGLTEDLGGAFSMDVNNGTCISVIFSLLPVNEYRA